MTGTSEANRSKALAPFTTRIERPNKPPLVGVGPIMVPEDELLTHMPDDQFEGMLTVFKMRYEAAQRGTRERIREQRDLAIQIRGRLQNLAETMKPGIMKQGLEKVDGHFKDGIDVLTGLLEKDL